MKANFEGKFVFEVGKFTVVACKGKGYSYEIPGEKQITVLPELGVELANRTLSFVKDTGICIEERDTYILVGPLAESMQAVENALTLDLMTGDLAQKINDISEKAVKTIADIMDEIPENGAIADLFNTLGTAATMLSGVDYMSAFGELVAIIQKKYPEFWEKLTGTMNAEEQQKIMILITQTGKTLKPDAIEFDESGGLEH